MKLTLALWYSLLVADRNHGDDCRFLPYHRSPYLWFERPREPPGDLEPSQGVLGLGCHLYASQGVILPSVLDN